MNLKSGSDIFFSHWLYSGPRSSKDIRYPFVLLYMIILPLSHRVSVPESSKYSTSTRWLTAFSPRGTLRNFDRLSGGFCGFPIPFCFRFLFLFDPDCRYVMDCPALTAINMNAKLKTFPNIRNFLYKKQK